MVRSPVFTNSSDRHARTDVQLVRGDLLLRLPASPSRAPCSRAGRCARRRYGRPPPARPRPECAASCWLLKAEKINSVFRPGCTRSTRLTARLAFDHQRVVGRHDVHHLEAGRHHAALGEHGQADHGAVDRRLDIDIIDFELLALQARGQAIRLPSARRTAGAHFLLVVLARCWRGAWSARHLARARPILPMSSEIAPLSWA
jgi:hypothetical protein